MRHDINQIRKQTEDAPISYVREKNPADDPMLLANRIRQELNELSLKAAELELAVLRSKWQRENERLRLDRLKFEREIDEAFEELEEPILLTRKILRSKVFKAPVSVAVTAIQRLAPKMVVRRFMSGASLVLVKG